MRVSFLFSLFREDLVRALLWTLVHSLWQGLALAILAALAILLTRRSAPVWRYNIFLGLLCLFVAGAGGTFLMMLKTSPVSSVVASGGGAVFRATDAIETPVPGVVSVDGGLSWGQRLTVFFDRRANIIVAIWCIILGIRLGRLLFDMWTVQRLRYYRASEPAGYWKARVMELAHSIGIRKVVRVLESSIVKTPVMAGVLKPVILVPLGLLAQLPPQEMEAILLHELAHIRRKDYLINLLQCIAEILFFFNPAVLWISSLLREERENCCDDIAVGKMHSKREFVNALVSFQEYSYPDGALMFAGARKHLLQRVKRIIHRDDKTLNMREKFFLLACLFITAGLTLTYARQTPVQIASRGPNVEMIWQAPPVKDAPLTDEAIPVKTEKTTDARQLVKTLRAVADTLKKPAPVKDTMSKEDEQKWEMKLQHKKDEFELLQHQKDEFQLQQRRLDEERERLADRQRELEMEQARLNLKYLKMAMDTLRLLPQDQSRLQLMEAQVNLDRLNHLQEESIRKSEERLTLNRLRLQGIGRLQMERLLETQRQLDGNGLQLLRATELTRQQGEKMHDIVKPVLRMLLEKGLVAQIDDVSFYLTNTELIVNGKKQSNEVFQEFKKEFIHSPEDFVKYSKHGGSESTSVNQHKD